ncbi:MAG: DinB family protein [Dehalococcoidia bacterium]|nr:DinB family protein [Dehalococcoidia bacterium]
MQPHPTYAAAAAVAGASLTTLGGVLDKLPDGALDWTPVSGTNAIAVLTIHSLTSLEFWLSAGAGRGPSRAEYLERRAEAFRARGLSVAMLQERLTQTTTFVVATLGDAEERGLATVMPWEVEGARVTGAECLFRGIGHLREHVGEAQLTRALWMAASREGR